MKLFYLFACIVVAFCIQPLQVAARIIYFPRDANNHTIGDNKMCLYASHNYNHHGDAKNCLENCRFNTKTNEVVCDFSDDFETHKVTITGSKPSCTLNNQTKFSKVLLYDNTKAKNNNLLYHKVIGGTTINFKSIGKYFTITTSDKCTFQMNLSNYHLTKAKIVEN